MSAKPNKANLFDPNCPSRDVLDLIGSKWSMLILCALYDSKTRTGRLRRTVQGISQKMLTQTLREMQQNGIVRRISYPEVPPRVEYELTVLGYQGSKSQRRISAHSKTPMKPLAVATPTRTRSPERLS